MENPSQRCGTCIFWNFKVSTVKCWGQCFNPSVRNSTYISFKLPLNTKWTKEQIYEIKNYAHNFTEIYFEENTFGCVYHSKRF